jgi:hypothetical protein
LKESQLFKRLLNESPPHPFFLTIIVVSASWFSETSFWEKAKASYISRSQQTYSLNNEIEEKLLQKVIEAKRFIRQKGYNDNYCLLIDMILPAT